MRANMVIDDGLLEEAFWASPARSKKGLNHEALKEFIRLKKRKDLTKFAGTISFHEDYDHKKLKKMEE